MVTLAKLRYLNPDIRLAGTVCEHDSNLNQSLATLDMSHPFHCDAEFLSFFDGRRCVLRFVIALVIGLVACGVTAASAPTYPQRPVRFILPFGPAAGTDITARLLGEKLAARWGKPVVIENRPGGDGLVAIHQCERRAHALVRSGFDLHGTPICARKTTLRRGARP